MRLYIIRHGDPDYTNDTLTERGHLEAKALAKRLVAEGITKIYCSPLGRAQDTMKYTAEMTGIEPITQDWFRELSASVTMEDSTRLAAWNVHGEIIRGEKPYPGYENWHERWPFYTADNLVDTFSRLKRASDMFLTSLGYERQQGRYKIVQPSREKIAVFCHAGFGLTWLAHLLEIPLPLVWSGFSLLPSSVTTVLFDERSAKWAVPRCITVGDVAHLYAANLPPSRAGIVANFD